jgi:hypothetical protein
VEHYRISLVREKKKESEIERKFSVSFIRGKFLHLYVPCLWSIALHSRKRFSMETFLMTRLVLYRMKESEGYTYVLPAQKRSRPNDEKSYPYIIMEFRTRITPHLHNNEYYITACTLLRFFVQILLRTRINRILISFTGEFISMFT